MLSGWSHPETVEHVEPELCRQTQRFNVDPFVVPVESAEKFWERHMMTEQAGAIRRHAALAEEAAARGARVLLVSGPTALAAPRGVERIAVETAAEMHEAVARRVSEADFAVLAAAVADYRPAEASSQKIKKDGGAGRSIALVQNPDILAAVTAVPGERVVIGFAAETENLEENARKKLKAKGCDLIVANWVGEAAEGAGFDSDENAGIALAADGRITVLERGPKREMARQIWDLAV